MAREREPNDTDKSPTNHIGAACVLHLDKNGRFINQWFGNHAGQGHFSMVHGIAINPGNGHVYIADREEYRLGAIGNGLGRCDGQFVESNYMAMDSSGSLYTGDTSVGRITKMVAPRVTSGRDRV